MPRPRKVGLDYFPEDVDRRNDFKIMDLLNEYGPLGYTIYDFCLQYIYANGYYLDVPLSQVVLLLTKDIGAKWIKNKDLVEQVIYYCANIGLFDNDLLQQNIITSVGIQRRYDEVTVRNKADKTRYWLLGKKQQIDEVANVFVTKKPINATETQVNATETQVNATETPQKKSKENESKGNKKESKEKETIRVDSLPDYVPKEISSAFAEYVRMRRKINKPLTEYALKRAVNKLNSLAPNDFDEQIQILNESIDHCWTGLFALKGSSDNETNYRNTKQTANSTNGRKTGTYY